MTISKCLQFIKSHTLGFSKYLLNTVYIPLLFALVLIHKFFAIDLIRKYPELLIKEQYTPEADEALSDMSIKILGLSLILHVINYISLNRFTNPNALSNVQSNFQPTPEASASAHLRIPSRYNIQEGQTYVITDLKVRVNGSEPKENRPSQAQGGQPPSPRM